MVNSLRFDIRKKAAAQQQPRKPATKLSTKRRTKTPAANPVSPSQHGRRRVDTAIMGDNGDPLQTRVDAHNHFKAGDKRNLLHVWVFFEHHHACGCFSFITVLGVESPETL